MQEAGGSRKDVTPMTDDTDIPKHPSLRDGAPRWLEPSRGTNQSGVRLYNERLLLSLIRRHGALPKAEIARLTGLSAQTVSVIMNGLDADGLLLKGDPQRGKVGQPSVPFAINPEGALALGLKIGRRSTDMVLVDFIGNVRKRIHAMHRFPLPDTLIDFASHALEEISGELTPELARRITGLGIATPFELWNWESEVGAPKGAMEGWRDFDTAAELQKLCPWPVFLCNDGTAACAAECFFGPAERQIREYLYVFIGSFVGGGVVLNGNVVQGRRGNAGAIGSLPVPKIEADGQNGGYQQLIRCASLYVLENAVNAAGLDPSGIWLSPFEWPDYGQVLEAWIEQSAQSLALLATSAAAIIDFDAMVIDGAFPAEVRTRLLAATTRALGRMDQTGLSPMTLIEGAIGPDARAVGAAALPLLASFARDHEVLFKEAVHAQGT